MVTVVGVRFKKAGKIYYFDPDTLAIEKGQDVIVETARGIEYGNAVLGIRDVKDDNIVPPLKKVLRIASTEDQRGHENNKVKAKEAFSVCEEKIQKHKLDMHLTDVEYTFDNNKVIFYFTADGRIDFRELVKDLASVFKTRIELRQIGVRDEAKALNGIGQCGCGLCCANWLGDFAPVSIKMAKDQNLSLNPTKISGVCGRLMCCLKYEHDTYIAVKKELPNRGDKVVTEIGEAVVVDTSILHETVKVRHITSKKGDHLNLSDDVTVYKKEELKEIHKSKNNEEDDAIVLEIDDDISEELLAEIEAELRKKKKHGCGRSCAKGKTQDSNEKVDSKDKKTSDRKPSDRKTSDRKPSDRKPSDKKSNDRKPSDRKPSDRKPNDRKPKPANSAKKPFAKQGEPKSQEKVEKQAKSKNYKPNYKKSKENKPNNE